MYILVSNTTYVDKNALVRSLVSYTSTYIHKHTTDTQTDRD